MKRMLLIAFLFALAGCQSGQKENPETIEAEAALGADWQQYGAAVEPEGAVDAFNLPELTSNSDSVFIRVKGEALSSCSKKGCWMKVKIAEGEEMRVTFKDYAFFVPKDLAGEEVVFEGVLTQQMVEVETLRHYAQDAGASEEALMQINEPKKEYSFEATGVLVNR